MNDCEVLKELYKKARDIDFGAALDMARQAKTKEEETFYINICNMNMQRKQKEIIERNIF